MKFENGDNLLKCDGEARIFKTIKATEIFIVFSNDIDSSLPVYLSAYINGLKYKLWDHKIIRKAINPVFRLVLLKNLCSNI